MVLAHVLRDLEQRMTEALKKYDECLLASKKRNIFADK
jgi:hypothetical protein